MNNQPIIPFTFLKKSKKIKSVSVRFPYYGQLTSYTNQFESEEYSDVNIETLQIQYSNFTTDQMIQWLQALHLHFKFRIINLQISDIHEQYFCQLYKSQSQAEEFSFTCIYPFKISQVERFLKDQIHFKKLKKLGAHFEIQYTKISSISQEVSQIMLDNHESLEDIHITTDARNFTLLLQSISQLSQQSNLSLFPNLQEITLNVQSLDLQIIFELMNQGIDMNSKYTDLKQLFNLVGQLKIFRFYSSQTITDISMIDDICSLIQRQQQLIEFVLYAKLCRIQFDIRQILSVLSKLANLSKIEINLDTSTQYMISQSESILDFPQVEHFNLSLVYSQCAAQILHSIRLTYLKSFSINISQLRNYQQYNHCFNYFIDLISQNPALSELSITCKDSTEFEFNSQTPLLNTILEYLKQFRSISLIGFSGELFTRFEWDQFFSHLESFDFIFFKNQRIQKIKKQLLISTAGEAQSRMNLSQLTDIFEASTKSINEIQYKGDVKLQDEEDEKYTESLLRSICQLSLTYQHLLKININGMQYYVKCSPEFIDKLLDTLQKSYNLYSLNLGYHFQSLIFTGKQKQELIQLVSKRYYYKAVWLNYELTSINEILNRRSKSFQYAIHSCKLMKQQQIYSAFRKDILSEIILYLYE